MAINMGTAVAYLELDTSKFKKGFKSAFNDLKVFGDKSATAEQKMKGLQSAFNKTGSLLTKSVTLPLLGVGTASTKVAMDFEAGMSEVLAISGATAKEFELLEDKAVEMGAKTKFSATESADAFKYMAMAGWDAEAMLSGIEGVMNLASASGEDLAMVSDIVTDSLTAFGLSADGTSKVLKDGLIVEVSNTTRFADVLAQASSKSNTNVALMGETFKYVAPVAGALGYSIEDTAVAIGLMANSGIKGSQAGTALRSVFTRLAKPTKQVQTAMNELDISLTNADGTMKPLNELLLQMRDRFSGLTEEQKAQYSAMIAGQEGMSGLLAIVNASESDFKTLTEQINNANGAAQEMASVMMDNTAGAVEQLKGALESAGILIGEKLTPYIRQLAEWITGLVEKFNSLSEEEQDQIVKFGLILAAIGPVLLILAKVISAVSTVVKAFKLFGTTMTTVKTSIDLVKAGYTGLATQMGGIPKLIAGISTGFGGMLAPIAAVIAIVAVLVGAFVTLWKTNEEFRDNMVGIWNGIKESINNFFDGVVERINALGFDFENITEVIKTAWFALCDVLAPVFEGAFNTIAIVLDGIFNQILSVMDIFIGLFTGNWEQLWKGVKGVVSGIVETFANLGSNILGVIGDIGAEILNKLGFEKAAEGFQNFFDTLSDLFGQIPELLSSAIDTIVSFFTVTIPEAFNNFVNVTVPNFINSIVSFFSNLPYNIGVIVGKLLGHIVLFGEDIKKWAETEVPKFIDSVVDFFSELPSRIYNWLIETINKIYTWGSKLISEGKRIASEFVEKVINYVKELPSKFKKWIDELPGKVKSIGEQLREAGKEILDKLWDGIKSVGKKITKWFENFADNIASFISGIVDGFNSVVSSANSAKKASKSVNGSHANGLDYVPFNGYVAELHKGERVLTKQENEEYNKGRTNNNGGDTFVFYNTKPDPYTYAKQMKRTKQELLYGF